MTKVVTEDLQLLRQKYKSKMAYYKGKINCCYEPRKEKYFLNQYKIYLKAQMEVNTLQQIHERTFNNGNKN